MSAAAQVREGASNYASLRVAVGPLAGPVVCRVVSMVAARADCPVDRLDDAMLLCDAITAHAPEHVPDGHVGLIVTAAPDGLELRLGPLVRGGAQQLIDEAEVPGVGNVLERVSDEVRIDSSEDGGDVLVIGLRF